MPTASEIERLREEGRTEGETNRSIVRMELREAAHSMTISGEKMRHLLAAAGITNCYGDSPSDRSALPQDMRNMLKNLKI